MCIRDSSQADVLGVVVPDKLHGRPRHKVTRLALQAAAVLRLRLRRQGAQIVRHVAEGLAQLVHLAGLKQVTAHPQADGALRLSLIHI